jgi:hypothetical protein
MTHVGAQVDIEECIGLARRGLSRSQYCHLLSGRPAAPPGPAPGPLAAPPPPSSPPPAESDSETETETATAPASARECVA